MSSIECIVLGLLHSGCCYGHELDKIYKMRNMNLWTKSSRVSVYQALNRIEKKGYATVSIEKSGNYPDRKVYALTPAGEDALREMVTKGLGTNDLIEFKICAYFSFFDLLPTEEVIRQLEKRMENCAGLLEVLTPSDDVDLREEDSRHFIRRHNVKLVRGYYELEIRWLEELIAELKQKKTEAV